MKKIGNVWGYHAEPEGEGSWNSITEFKTLNCEMEEITVEQECSDCPVNSVAGEIANSRKIGYSIQGQRTYVWGDVGISQKPCEVKRLPRRFGQIFNESGVLRLRDPIYLMDFILGPQRNSCEPGQPSVFTVQGERGMGIQVINKSNYQRRRRSASTPVPMIDSSGPILTLQEYLPGHLQYMADTSVDHENRIADSLNILECRTSKDRLNQLYTLSKMSGIMAARSLKMDNCQSLESFGSTGVIRQCRPVNIDFGVDNTSRCGPQPKSGDYGISSDGFLLIPYSQCFWKSTVINFRGIPYEARNG